MSSRWFCEGKELENSPDIQIITNGEQHSLIIAEAFEEDTGRYSCFASNFYGTDSTSAEIYIEGLVTKLHRYQLCLLHYMIILYFCLSFLFVYCFLFSLSSVITTFSVAVYCIFLFLFSVKQHRGRNKRHLLKCN